MELISVVIPTHNRSNLLKRSIASVLQQTHQNLECIVVVDGSKDDTVNILSEIKDSRLRYYQHDMSMGASAARNTGILHSSGKYIAFLDDDDEWTLNKLEKQLKLIENSPNKVGMVYCWMDYYNENNEIIRRHHPTLKGNVFKDVLESQRIGGCPTLLVRKSVINDVGGFDEKLPRGNDGDFIRRVTLKYEVDYIPEVLVHVHINHGHEQIGDFSSKGIKNAILGEKAKLEKFFEHETYYPEQFSNINLKISRHHIILKDWKQAFVYLRNAIKVKGVSMNVASTLLYLCLKYLKSLISGD